MKQLIRFTFFIILSTVISSSFGQMNEYDYSRKLSGINDQWHRIVLPNDLFGKTLQSLSDLRVYGISEDNDTIEAPYIFRVNNDKIENKKVPFNLLNSSSNEEGYYFTLEVPTNKVINEIKLDFEKENFDWRITLEGGHNQREWFTIIENYRILSIKNSLTDFQFTTMKFPRSKYQYYRLKINTKEDPQLNVARVAEHEVTNGLVRNYDVKKINTVENNDAKRTEIDVELEMPVRISQIALGIKDPFDYYRPITIKYLKDSFKTEVGWKYNYGNLATGTLNSLEKNEFQFNSITAQKLKILIENHDNQSLEVEAIEIKGYVHELIARFTSQATYYLTYGNEKATKPNYDIARFTDNIPNTLSAVELGNEVMISKNQKAKSSPLFENKLWLWLIMTGIILVLGWFSIKMIKNK